MIPRLSPIFATCEALIVPHMMSLAVNRLYLDGYELRLDARGHLENSLKVILRRHPKQSEVQLIASETDTSARNVMRDTDFDDAKTALFAISYLALKLVDERLYRDVKDQAILTALMLIADAEEDQNPETAGVLKVAKEKAGRALDVLLREGFFNHTLIQ